MAEPTHAERRAGANRAGKLADMAWRYYARKVGVDPYAVTGSPLIAIVIATRRTMISNEVAP